MFVSSHVDMTLCGIKCGHVVRSECQSYTWIVRKAHHGWYFHTSGVGTKSRWLERNVSGFTAFAMTEEFRRSPCMFVSLFQMGRSQNRPGLHLCFNLIEPITWWLQHITDQWAVPSVGVSHVMFRSCSASFMRKKLVRQTFSMTGIVLFGLKGGAFRLHSRATGMHVGEAQPFSQLNWSAEGHQRLNDIQKKRQTSQRTCKSTISQTSWPKETKLAGWKLSARWCDCWPQLRSTLRYKEKIKQHSVSYFFVHC